jgi:hypothetical protein
MSIMNVKRYVLIAGTLVLALVVFALTAAVALAAGPAPALPGQTPPEASGTGTGWLVATWVLVGLAAVLLAVAGITGAAELTRARRRAEAAYDTRLHEVRSPSPVSQPAQSRSQESHTKAA